MPLFASTIAIHATEFTDDASPERLALCLEYDGAAFCGWQTQKRRQVPSDGRLPGSGTVKTSVQEVLEEALTVIAGMPLRAVAAGRTDAGVHASAQVVHVDVSVARPPTAWVRGVNAHLPGGVAVRWVQPVNREFHARFSATARHYTYWLLNRPERSALWVGRVGWYHRPLEVEAMAAAAQHLLGTHDFSAFRASQCQAKSPVKTLSTFSVTRHGDFIRFICTGNAFLHHMVRNIVGALLWVGEGKRPPEWVAALLAARERAPAGPTFAAAGLYLTGVDYDARFGLPPARQEVWLAPPAMAEGRK